MQEAESRVTLRRPAAIRGAIILLEQEKGYAGRLLSKSIESNILIIFSVLYCLSCADSLVSSGRASFCSSNSSSPNVKYHTCSAFNNFTALATSLNASLFSTLTSTPAFTSAIVAFSPKAVSYTHLTLPTICSV
eukprot:TRINITY_DN920_c0_g7_i1.p1 TRINITY_DN920_c0_g7~~TRINITY_DN920_c0_g7_i1.p1  ORF type:complete len:134 (+),score=1.56 TRINITY_DN920_c0_g7_i1:121-522(+)